MSRSPSKRRKCWKPWAACRPPDFSERVAVRAEHLHTALAAWRADVTSIRGRAELTSVLAARPFDAPLFDLSLVSDDVEGALAAVHARSGALRVVRASGRAEQMPALPEAWVSAWAHKPFEASEIVRAPGQCARGAAPRQAMQAATARSKFGNVFVVSAGRSYADAVKKDLFPIVEVFGHRWNATTAKAKNTFEKKWCPFTDSPCEKFRQYRFGYCSVPYAAADDGGRSFTYAVCDHRLDGAPLAHVVTDHFGKRKARLVPEIVLTEPRTSFDYVAQAEDNPEDVIAIETQAIDIRGGGVGPAWRAWERDDALGWRSYFTQEAKQKGRKDTVAYGVNMANIYKRLGLQVAVKGSYLKGIGVPFYVLMQDRPFQYLRRRINFAITEKSWDITFVTFEYEYPDNGSDDVLKFSHCQTVRTTIADYVAAMSTDTSMANAARAVFLERVKRKAGLSK